MEHVRLGITFVPNKTPDYGDNVYQGLEPDEEFKNNVMIARLLIKENLTIFSTATIQLMELWQKYKHYLLVDLPPVEKLWDTEPVHYLSFVKKQQAQIVSVKSLLDADSNSWLDSARKIIEEEMTHVSMDKDQRLAF